MDLAKATIARYAEAGWIVHRQKCINDMLAHKGARLHFVQFVTDPTAARHTGQARSEFVQNAFSNCAAPVLAELVNGKVVLRDIGTIDAVVRLR